MKLLKGMRAVPGGLLLLPMLLAAVVNTAAPGLLPGAGGPVTAVCSAQGVMACIGLVLFITGAQVRVRQLPAALRGSLLPALCKIGLACLAGWALARLGGDLWGLTELALVPALASCNPGLYLALMQQYGSEEQRAAYGPLNLLGVPQLPLFVLCVSAGAAPDYKSLAVTLAPFVLGALLGNLDRDLAAFLAPGSAILLPFLGLGLGSSINLAASLRAGPGGALLTAVFLAVSLPALLLLDRLALGGDGTAGIALCNVAGVTTAVPALAAQAMPQYAAGAAQATAQLAMAAVLTAVLSPLLVRRHARRRTAQKRGGGPGPGVVY